MPPYSYSPTPCTPYTTRATHYGARPHAARRHHANLTILVLIYYPRNPAYRHMIRAHNSGFLLTR
eukprot:scaffold36274_cov125-Isochrysis_galbana.AAC.17